MVALVEARHRFHSQGFVHGDLRDANILIENDGIMKLVDFDWGGEVDQVSYPTPTLNRELLDGRVSEDLKITKADDFANLAEYVSKSTAAGSYLLSVTLLDLVTLVHHFIATLTIIKIPSSLPLKFLEVRKCLI